MKNLAAILMFLLLLFNLQGQTPVGTWSDHLIYNTANSVAIGSEDVIVSTGSSVMVYNKKLAELRKMSRINGLTETGIGSIAWSEENKTLIIAYLSTNIDLVKNNTIFNIPDIDRKYIPGNKAINRIRTSGKYAYLACSFGLIVIDLVKKEIFDTWRPGAGLNNAEVWDITFGNNVIYAATGNGVYSADLSNPGLSYFGNWDLINAFPNPTGKYTLIIYSGNKLYVNLSDPLSGGDSVYIFDGVSSLFSYFPEVYNTSFDPGTTGFTISSSSSVQYYNNSGALQNTISSYSWGKTKIAQAIVDNGNIWIADTNSGLVLGENMTVFSKLSLPGPVSNNAYSITSRNGKTIICGGGADASGNNLAQPLQVSIHENNAWTSVPSGTINDAMRALIDPDDINHFFVSSWGDGLLEFLNNNLVQQYTGSNSPLQTTIQGRPNVKVCGLATDKNKNLWITQTSVPGSIKVLKPDGSWIVNPVTIDAPLIADIIIAKNGYKWILLPGENNLFVLDDNHTPENFTDDRSKKITVQDISGSISPIVYSLAEDLDGYIWAGTDEGPLVYYNPEKVFTENLKANRVLVPRNDGSGKADYLLHTETITSIAVDGANRKWMGTATSGAYLLSPEGTTRILNYTEQNSPVLSNSIVSLSVDNKTGDVWFGTSKGIQSIRGNTTTGAVKFSKVYSFPNPVREDYTGNVTITGLMRDTQIKITDISGNLVFETMSDGGQATWDLKTYNGRRVTTGVYLIFCSSSDGTQSAVSKMLVIK